MTQPSVYPTGDVRRQFGAVAAAYATSAVHASGPDLTALVAAAALTGTERVLDLGCGAGHTALALAPTAAEVVGVDLTPEMLATAAALAAERGAANISFRDADVARLPFADQCFDLVTSRYSAHHYAEPERALVEAARVLRPGGRFLLVDTIAPETPALDTFYNAVELLRDSSHVRNWSVSEWSAMLIAAGFASVDVLFEMKIDLDGDTWVKRMQTAPDNIAAIKTLFRCASPAAVDLFELRLDQPWGWRIPSKLLSATLPRA